MIVSFTCYQRILGENSYRIILTRRVKCRKKSNQCYFVASISMQHSVHFISACSSKSQSVLFKGCFFFVFCKKIVPCPLHFPSIETTNFTSDYFFYFSEQYTYIITRFLKFQTFFIDLDVLLSTNSPHMYTFPMYPSFQNIYIKILIISIFGVYF